MKFENYQYKRPDINKIKLKYLELLKKLKQAVDFNSFSKVLAEIKKLRDNFQTMDSLVEIRYKINTKDEFYKNEKKIIDEISPVIQNIDRDFFESIVKSKFKEDFERRYGRNIIEKMGLSLKIISPDVTALLEKENKLKSEYSRLIGSAELLFQNKKMNLSEIRGYFESKDRNIRKESNEVFSKFFFDNEAKFDAIYDELVKVRHEIALKLGYKSFVDLAYDRWGRNNFNKKMIEQLRKNLLSDFIPFANKLREWQRKNLGLDKLYYYDEPVFLNEEIKPRSDADFKVKTAEKMFSEMGNETKKFFKHMAGNNLLDLIPRYGKSGGGFCDFIKNEKSPFIFMNFDGSSKDIITLVHECGHALAVYLNRDKEFLEWNFVGLETAEVHSMSMEFFSWPWMKLFFDEDNKFKLIHLIKSVQFVPYGLLVDEFQHWVYENTNASIQKRKLEWRKIEKKYLTQRDYEENEFLEKGNFWTRQLHLFEYPLYYIDYVIAQFCAFQYLLKSIENYAIAWKNYIELIKCAISKDFLNSIKIGGLKNPFEESTIREVTKDIEMLFNEFLIKSIV